ncbi:hypothetical protein GCM10020216_105180 [Nonomuraea helvata]
MAYGDATGLVFVICAAVAAVLLEPVTLRTSLDKPDVARSAAIAAEAALGTPTFDQTTIAPASNRAGPLPRHERSA